MKESFFDVFKNNALINFTLVGISYCDGSYKIKRSKSDFYVIEYIIDGEGTLEIDGKVFYPKKGDVYFVQPETNHTYYSSKENPWVKIWANFKGPLADLLIEKYHLTGKYYFENFDIYNELKNITKMCPGENGGFNAGVELEKILYKMYLSSPEKQKVSDAKKLKGYIDKNAKKPIRISDMASFLGKSPSQITKDFKKEYNISPYDYLLERKISESKKLLENTALSIKQIAMLLSFADEYYFSNMFKKRVGMSPLYYRRRK